MPFKSAQRHIAAAEIRCSKSVVSPRSEPLNIRQIGAVELRCKSLKNRAGSKDFRTDQVLTGFLKTGHIGS
jgi:hypothetical protein